MSELIASTTVEQSLIDYLTGVRALRRHMLPRMPTDFKYHGFEDFLLQHGRFFTPRELPETVRPMPLSLCYENAFRVASRTKALHYVEGFAVAVVPMLHAFLVDKDGFVVDPTWATAGFGTAYLGVELDLEQVKRARRAGMLSLSDDYRHDFPLMRGENVIAHNAWFAHSEP